MEEVTLTISGGPRRKTPDIPPLLPENPDLSGLRNLVEEEVDEKQKAQPKSSPLTVYFSGNTYLVFDTKEEQYTTSDSATVTIRAMAISVALNGTVYGPWSPLDLYNGGVGSHSPLFNYDTTGRLFEIANINP